MALTTYPSIDPHYGTAKKTAYRKLEAQFGDGYSQRARDGLNSRRRTWNVVYKNLPDTDADTIETFLDARGSDEAFNWTPPRSVTSLVVSCPEGVSRTPSGHEVSNLSFTLREEFDLTT